MSEKKLSYNTRDYDGCREAILEMMQKYYPDVFGRINDASIGQWLVDVMADIYDNLNFHADRLYQETNLDSASRLNSLLDIARTNGVKIPGKKAAIVEVELSCMLPPSNGDTSSPDYDYAPIIRRGSLFSTGQQTFELAEDVDFSEQFNQNGISNRTIVPRRNSNGSMSGFKVSKLAVAQAGYSKVFKRPVYTADLKPFMEITLQDSNILGVEGIVCKEGITPLDPQRWEYYTDYTGEFKVDNIATRRFFEVDSLVDQFRFGDVVEKGEDGNGNDELTIKIKEETVEYKESDKEGSEESTDKYQATVCRITQGKWSPLKRKFTTEYNDDWTLKITFGGSVGEGISGNIDSKSPYVEYLMSKMEANDQLGVLPENESTLYILYRVGGGEMSNIATDTLTNLIYLDATFPCNSNDSNRANKSRAVKDSLKVTNPSPSYGGKDEPSVAEIKKLIQSGCISQNRAVTLQDYYAILNKMPAKYGLPFRMSVVEENNKIVVYALGLDFNGHLERRLYEGVAANMVEWLRMYKTVTDLVEVRPGRVVNLKFQINLVTDKAYNQADVSKRVIEAVRDYMDIKKHMMGEDIYLGDLIKEIVKLDGVVNLSSLRVYNPIGGDYSNSGTTMELVGQTDCYPKNYWATGDNSERQIDLEASDNTLIGDAHCMYEILKPEGDITIFAKSR